MYWAITWYFCFSTFLFKIIKTFSEKQNKTKQKVIKTKTKKDTKNKKDKGEKKGKLSGNIGLAQRWRVHLPKHEMQETPVQLQGWKDTLGGHSNLLQYTCLENPMERRAFWTTVHRVTKRHSWSKLTQHTHMWKYIEFPFTTNATTTTKLQMKEFWRLAEEILYNQDNHLKELSKEE